MAADFQLQLSDIVFEDFEIPSSLHAGGGQSLAVHHYPGGIRTIDALGPDDKALQWAGIFDGPDAEARCQQLDVMRRQGEPQVLFWSSYSYLAIIRNFEWEFKRFWHISYKISLEVVQDLINTPPRATVDVEQLMASDAAAATTAVEDINTLAGNP